MLSGPVPGVPLRSRAITSAMMHAINIESMELLATHAIHDRITISGAQSAMYRMHLLVCVRNCSATYKMKKTIDSTKTVPDATPAISAGEISAKLRGISK